MGQLTTTKPMTAAEARVLVAGIKDRMESCRHLLLQLYEREGWRALGYDSWRACAVAEFELSQGHLYRLLQFARAEQISPTGENAPENERQFREQQQAARLQELANKALASMPAAEQLRRLQEAEAAVLARARPAKQVGGEDRKGRLGQIARTCSRLKKLVSGLGDESEEALGHLAAFMEAIAELPEE
jgi:hypothetical protein